MTIEEVRNHEEYAQAMEKIKRYPKGFRFTLNYSRIPTPQANALRIVMRDAIKERLIMCVETGLSLECEITEETFEKI